MNDQMTDERNVVHRAEYYEEDVGWGWALCGERIGPWWMGPHGRRMTCSDCIEKARDAARAEEGRR